MADDRLPLSRLARQFGIPEPTARGWKRHGLSPDEHNRVSPAELLAFCEDHAHLRAAGAALPRLREAGSAESTAQGLRDLDPARDDAAPGGAAAAAPQARAAARSARAAAREHALAVLAAARAAETVAREHREQIERLVAAYQLLDDALVEVTGPVDLRG